MHKYLYWIQLLLDNCDVTVSWKYLIPLLERLLRIEALQRITIERATSGKGYWTIKAQ